MWLETWKKNMLSHKTRYLRAKNWWGEKNFITHPPAQSPSPNIYF